MLYCLPTQIGTPNFTQSVLRLYLRHHPHTVSHFPHPNHVPSSSFFPYPLSTKKKGCDDGDGTTIVRFLLRRWDISSFVWFVSLWVFHVWRCGGTNEGGERMLHLIWQNLSILKKINSTSNFLAHLEKYHEVENYRRTHLVHKYNSLLLLQLLTDMNTIRWG